ncbi:MAG: InlB B-repeat-containing protein [Clostridia bacterium]|nr:InlB B-repeat-containing protein [Clostridia bacterium]
MKGKRVSILILLLTLAITACLALVGCSGGGDDDTVQVNVTFDLCYQPSNGSQTSTVKIDAEDDSATLNYLGVSYTRLGYNFLGYYDSKEAGVQIFDESGNQLIPISADITLYAKWSVVTYQKTFTSTSANANVDAIEPLNVQIQQVFSTLPQPEMAEGFEFVGWATAELNNGGVLISNGTTVKGEYKTVSASNSSVWLNNSSFVAVVDVSKFTVSLIDYENSENNQELTYNYNAAISNLPVLENDDEKMIEFVGWSTDYYTYKPYTSEAICQSVKQDIELYAFYYEYKILEFYIDNTENFVPVKIYDRADVTFEMPDIPNPGRRLVGWYNTRLFNTSPITRVYYNQAITKLYGKYELIDYTAKFDLNGGSVTECGELSTALGATELDNITYNVESEIELPVLEKERFTFKGWYRSDDETKTPIRDIEQGTYGDFTLIAKFEGDKRKVIYHANEGSLGVNYKLVEYYSDYVLDIPTSDIHGFFGWYLDENFEIQLTDANGKGVANPKWTSYDEETHVYAKFLQKRYIILSSSHLDAGSVELKDHYVEGETVNIEVEAKEQYSVEGIMVNGVKVSSNSTYEFTMPADDIMLHVVYNPKTYTITLEVGENEYCSKNSATVQYGELFTLPVAFKEGYRFVGWEYVSSGRAKILTNSDGTSKDGYLYTSNITAKPYYVVDKTNKDIIIKSVADLIKIRDDASATYQLVANINMQGRIWEPFDFSGTFNGNGYTISNLTINKDSGNVAMFNKLTGKVDGLTFANLNVISTSYTGASVAGVCYELDGGSITNCVIESGKIGGEVGSAGGFVALLTSGTINNCVNKANVETDTTNTNGSYAIGGIVGFASAGTITNCTNYGAIESKIYVGGIVGRSKDGSSLVLNHLANYGSVTGDESYVGGIIGRYDRDKEYSITNLLNTGKIEGVDYVGGLFGYWENAYNTKDNNARKVVVNAFENSGTVIGEGNYVGGLIGKVYFDAPYYYIKYEGEWNGTLALVMKESKNTGEIKGGLYVGGLIGAGSSDTSVSVIEKAINNSKVTAKARVGGIAGDLSTINLTSPSNLGSTIIATETSIESSNKYAYLGGYVGLASNSNISSATNSSDIIYKATSCEGNYVGGIAGYSTGTFTDCKNTAIINAPKSNYVGGIAGRLAKNYDYTIKNVVNTGEITGNTYVAGIFGEWYNVYNIKDSNARIVNAIGFENSGNIKGTGNYVGGLMGNATFEAPYYYIKYEGEWNGTLALVMRAPKNTGDIEGALYVGGLIGKVYTDSGTSMIEEGVNSSSVKAYAIIGAIAGETSTIKLVETSNRNSTVTALATYDSGSSKYAYVGGYVGYAGNTVIENAVNNVTIDYSATLCVGNYVGGIAGYSTGTFENCVNNATVYAPKSSYVGGISGRLSKSRNYNITTVKNTANITGVTYVAGIFGEWHNEENIKDNNARTVNAIGFENSGKILGTGNYVGGLVGMTYFDAPYYYIKYEGEWNGTIALVMKESKNTGDVEGVYYVGGLMGRVYTDSSQSNFIETSSIANVKAEAITGALFGEAETVKLTATTNEGSTLTATGTYVDGTNNYAYVGGYVGRAYNVTITDSVNTVNVDYSGELCLGNYVGGFTGYSSGIFTNVENKATVYAPNVNYVGGISGALVRTHAYNIENVKNTANITGNTYVAGIFGYWLNEHNTKDNSARRVDANNFTNTGDIIGSGNYVAGLIGYLKFDAPYYYIKYEGEWNGQQMLYMKDAVNSGNVTGVENVGGLMGYCYTDSSTSELFTYTQTGVVTGVNKVDNLIGEVANLKLPAVE